MGDIFSSQIPAPFGAVALHVQQGCLVSVDFVYGRCEPRREAHPLLQDLEQQLQRYFSGEKMQLSSPLRLRGTEFQLRVWQALQQIPAGEVRTYGQLAEQLSSSARAVGGACRANPVPLFVPCHRIVAAGGLGGFSGARAGEKLDAKRWLLQHEGVRCD